MFDPDSAICLAVETSCRQGGLALSRGVNVLSELDFQAGARHAVQLVARMDDLLKAHGLTPADVDALCVSAGPGSFTGLRIGITVARTLAQAVPSVHLVAVPTPHAVAMNAQDLDWQRLAVIQDAKDDRVYVSTFTRNAASPAGRIVPDGPGKTMTEAAFLAETPRPVTLIGEGLGYHDLAADGIHLAEPDRALPTPTGVLRVGWELAREGKFTPRNELLPHYTRRPEAVRLWEARHGDRQG